MDFIRIIRSTRATVNRLPLPSSKYGQELSTRITAIAIKGNESNSHQWVTAVVTNHHHHHHRYLSYASKLDRCDVPSRYRTYRNKRGWLGKGKMEDFGDTWNDGFGMDKGVVNGIKDFANG